MRLLHGTDAIIYNISSVDALPANFTVAEFLDSLAKINGVESNLETALDNVPLIKDKMDLRIEALSDEELALLHVVMFMTIKPYINIWAVPFAPDEYMKNAYRCCGRIQCIYICFRQRK